MREYPGTEETGQGGWECSRPAGAEVQYIQTSSCGVERHIVSGFLRALLSLSQEKSSGVEIDPFLAGSVFFGDPSSSWIYEGTVGKVLASFQCKLV